MFGTPENGKRVYVSATGDCYDSTRLLWLDLIRHFDVDGDPIAMVPHRDRFIVTGSNDREGLETMLAIATEDLQNPWSVSGSAFRLEGETWEPWLPDRDHPQHRKFADLRLQSIGRQYADQAELLNKLNEKTGVDVFVATFGGIRNQATGEVVSYAVWAKNVATRLPKVDMLGFVSSKEEKPLLVAWDKAVAVVGDLMTPLDMCSVRYKVVEFPNQQQLRTLARDNELT